MSRIIAEQTRAIAALRALCATTMLMVMLVVGAGVGAADEVEVATNNTGDSTTKTVTVTYTAIVGIEIAYDDGSAEGGWSMGPGDGTCSDDGGDRGYAIRMTTPDSEPFTITAIKLFSRRYGQDCNTRFEIWDPDRNTLYSDVVSHSEYSTEVDSWDSATWGYKGVPDVVVSDDFYIAMYTDSSNPSDEIYPDTGVYVGFDTSFSSDRSYTTQGKNLTWDLTTPQATTNWMIRVVGTADNAETTPVHNINKDTNYTTIQAAIDDADSGDEIHVDSGTYYENVNISKQLTLLGVDIGSGKPVIDAQEQGNAITLLKDGITLNGFTAINASSGSGIKINSNNSIISGNTVANNYLGIYIRYSSNVNISDNMAVNNGWGIYLHQSSNNFITTNVAYLNDYQGIGLHSSSDNNTIENNIANNNFFEGISIGESKNNTVVNNTANDNVQDGIILFSSDYNKIMQNIGYNNAFFSIDLQNSKNNIIFLNNLNNGNSYNSTNVFNSNYPIIYEYNNSTFTNYLGNYWSDYASIDENDDGIGETPYNLSSPEGQDNYPLIEPWKVSSSYDTTPPTNILNFSYIAGPTWINWTWYNPSDVDFSKVMVYVNDVFRTDVLSPVDYYNATGLNPNTQYCISVFTVDISGNINQTWVNHTATTKATGDFSGDGITDSWDITYLARSITGIPGYDTLSSGDVSGDGVVDAWDCTYLARAIAGVPGYSV